MKIGGRSADWGPDLEEALRDPRVGKVALHLERAQDTRLLDYAMYATTPISTDTQLPALLTSLRGVSRSAAMGIGALTAAMRSTLTADQLRFRKGAVVQTLVERLVRSRPGVTKVLSERRLVFATGDVTAGMDVVGVSETVWEAHECKAGPELPPTQAAELTWMAKTAIAEGEPLVVSLTSAASRMAVELTLRGVTDGNLLCYVAQETIFRLPVAQPSDHI